MKNKIKKYVLPIFVTIIIIILTVFLCLYAFVANEVDTDFDIELFKGAKSDGSTIFLAYDEQDNVKEIFSIDNDGKKEWCSLNDVGKNLIDGFISMEDRDFYKHKGVNIKRTASALLNYISLNKEKFGGSTITQQVIKNISGDKERSFTRKIKEIYRAYSLEKHLSKDEILEMYLNIVPMSGNMYGVKKAAEVYFNKDPDKLDLAEAATIIGVTNSPAKYDPYTQKEACLEKRNKVLYAMYDNGCISEEQYNDAKVTPLNICKKEDNSISDWFVETAREQILEDLMEKYDINFKGASLMLKGCKVILTMDPNIQKQLEEYFENKDNFPTEIEDGLNYGFVVIDNESGNLSGIIGSALMKKGNKLLNYSTIKVTPGSTLKPLALYAPLLEQGKINYASVFDDSPTKYVRADGSSYFYPKNAPNEYSGLITVRDALRLSKNTVAVRLLQLLGKEEAFDLLRERYGFNLVKKERNANGKIITDLDIAPLALGQLTEGISLYDLTAAYSAFPRDGVLADVKSYYGVFDSGGQPILVNDKSEKNIYSKATSQIMNRLLMNVVEDGTAWNISLKELVDTAGKTGTSGNDLDRLFIGYTPYYTAGIWCGYKGQKKPIGQLWPSHMNIWDSLMISIHKEKINDIYDDEMRGFSTSELEYLPFCLDSGELYSNICDLDLRGSRISYGYFTKNNAPRRECHRHSLCYYDFESGEVYFSSDEPIGDVKLIPISMVIYDREEMDNIIIKDSSYILCTEEFDLIYDSEKNSEYVFGRKRREC